MNPIISMLKPTHEATLRNGMKALVRPGVDNIGIYSTFGHILGMDLESPHSWYPPSLNNFASWQDPTENHPLDILMLKPL